VPDEGALGALLAERMSPHEKVLHERPRGSICIHAVTQLEIASTEIRNLVAAGYDPRFLMPDPVRDLIMESSCYTDRSQ
jgi:nicotinate-nucleotide adenylyltransferase